MASPESARSVYIGVLCVLVSSIGFSAKTVVIKLAYQYSVDVMTLLALRMLFSLPLFLLMAWWAGASPRPLTRNDWLNVLGLGFVGYYLGSYLDFTGLQYITAGLGRLILYLYPTLVLLLSALVLKEPVRARHLVSLALSYGGIALVFQHELATPAYADNTGRMALGAILVFGGAVTYAIYLIAGARLVLTLGSMRFAAYASITASCFVLAHFSITHEPAQLAVAHEVYLLVAIMAVFSTVLPLWLMAEGLKRVGASQAALLACVGPVSTIGLAYIFLGEPVTAVQLAGAALVLAGVMIISTRPRAAD